MPGPLAGIKVIDMTRVIAGPLAAQTLADLGADVVKVERLGDGDDVRTLGPPWLPGEDGQPTGEATYFQSVNRNKRSLQIDFATPEGAAVLRRMATGADVFLENFRPGTLAKYGLGYDDIAAANPRIIYCSLTGFGQTGPYAERSGYDYLVQAMAGMMEATGLPDDVPGGGPMRVGVPLADYAAGQNAVISVLAALRHRDRTGAGQHIDIALFDSQLAMMLNHGAAWLNGRQRIPRTGNDHPTAAPYGVFSACDGKLLIATFNDREFARLAVALGHAEWPEDPRFRRSRDRVHNRSACIAAVSDAIAEMSREEVLARLHEAKISAGPINTMADLEHDPQVLARGMIVALKRRDGREVRVFGSPLRLPASPVSYRNAPPAVGEDTAAIIAEWGVPEAGTKATV